MTSAYLFQIQSALIFALMCFGISKRRERNLHVPIMGTVIGWDLILILQIELNRGAVLKASHALTNPMMLNIHVSLAVTSVVLYGFLIFTGRKLLNNNFNFKKFHKKLGWTAFIFRLLTLITSFYAVTL
jgi:hypothetical protein